MYIFVYFEKKKLSKNNVYYNKCLMFLLLFFFSIQINNVFLTYILTGTVNTSDYRNILIIINKCDQHHPMLILVCHTQVLRVCLYLILEELVRFLVRCKDRCFCQFHF